MTQGYQKDQWNTLLFKDDSGVRLRLDPSDELAISYDGDVLLKHGKAELVEARMNILREAYRKSGQMDLAEDVKTITLPVDKLTDEMLQEINACLEISGRVAHLADRLAAMAPAETAPEP